MHSLFTAAESVLEYPTIYGISTSLRHIKLAYTLSKHPELEVEFAEDIPDFYKESLHAAYLLTFLDDQTRCLLIKNKGSENYFYSKYKKADYLLCSLSDDEINIEIIQILSKLSGISICFALDIPNQKEIQNFSQLQ